MVSSEIHILRMQALDDVRKAQEKREQAQRERNHARVYGGRKQKLAAEEAYNKADEEVANALRYATDLILRRRSAI